MVMRRSSSSISSRGRRRGVPSEERVRLVVSLLADLFFGGVWTSTV